MPSAAFLRAANVGGNNVFSPKQFVAEHAELKLTNIGHAGTFVSALDAKSLTVKLQSALPIDVPMAIVSHDRIVQLVAQAPPLPEGAKAEVTVFLAEGHASTTDHWPADDWEIQLLAEHEWCAVTARRPGGRLSPYKVLEASTGRPGTTRSWGVMEKVARATPST